MSVAPISDKNKEPWSTSISGLDGVAQKPWGWNGFASYLNALDAAKPSVNLSSYVGLGTVRLDVMGMEDRPPTAEELRLMEEAWPGAWRKARGIWRGSSHAQQVPVHGRTRRARQSRGPLRRHPRRAYAQ
ncbi:MAG: hypothetical protein ACLSHC_01700 [Bilophila wadsworthia]